MPALDEIKAFLASNPTRAVEAYSHVSVIAEVVAQSFLNDGGSAHLLDRTVRELLPIALNLSEAEVASCRLVVHNEQVDLMCEVKWADGVTPFGTVPQSKHRDDCKTRLKEVTAFERTEAQNGAVRTRRQRDETDFYQPTDIEHFEALGSEVFIPLLVGRDAVPKAIIVLGHRDKKHFTQDRLARLRQVHGLFNALFQLADFAEDRYAKGVLLQETAEVLPLVAQAPSRDAFARAVCALLTCSKGFGFHRAMFFWMKERKLPAVCGMAVGGIGEQWPDFWKAIPLDGSARLVDWIKDGQNDPIPKVPGRGDTIDPLFLQACRKDGGLQFLGNESATLAEFIRTGQGSGGPALRLDHTDPWIATSHQARGEMFWNNNDEFFVFLLRPVGPNGHEEPIGLVIADSPYHPQKHMPGLGFPDLQMTAFALNLIAGLWHLRENTRSHFHMLAAMPAIRHSGGRILLALTQFVDSVQPAGFTDVAKKRLEELEVIARDLARAKGIIEDVRGHARDERIPDLRQFLAEFGNSAQGIHNILVEERRKIHLEWEIASDFPGSISIRMHPDDLHSILTCLVSNAVVHGRLQEGSPVKCRLSLTEKREVPLGNKPKETRFLLEIENDGKAIDVDLMSYLFADGVSTDPSNGQGTGLSSARQIAKSYGGDVILMSPYPVRFGVVLEPPPL